MAKYEFPTAVTVFSADLPRPYSYDAGVVELSDEDIEVLSKYAPGVATLYVAPPVPAPAPVVAPAPAPSEV